MAQHPRKEVREAIQYAESQGWTVVARRSGHAWGTATCGHGCRFSIWSTPKNSGNHAKQIGRAVDRCPH